MAATDIKYAVASGYELALNDKKVVQRPSRGSIGAAGVDIPLPVFTSEFQKDFEEKNNGSWGSWHYCLRKSAETSTRGICLPAGKRLVFPTGLKFNIPEGTYLQAANRSGLSAKNGILVGGGIIDSDYQGIVFVTLINTGDSDHVFYEGDRITQLIHKKYIHSSFYQTSEEELFEAPTERAEGGHGSTGA